IGSRRRAAASASPSRVWAFSRTSSSSRAACQVAPSTTGGAAGRPAGGAGGRAARWWRRPEWWSWRPPWTLVVGGATVTEETREPAGTHRRSAGRGELRHLRDGRGARRREHHLRRARQPAPGAQPERASPGDDVGLRGDDEQVGAPGTALPADADPLRVHAAEAAGADDPAEDGDLARDLLPGVERVGEPLDPDAAASQFGDELRELDGEIVPARPPGAVEGGVVRHAGVVPEAHPDVDPAPESVPAQGRTGDDHCALAPPLVPHSADPRGDGSDQNVGGQNRWSAAGRSRRGGPVRPVATSRDPAAPRDARQSLGLRFLALPRSVWSSTTLRMRTVAGVTSTHSSSAQNSSACSRLRMRGGTRRSSSSEVDLRMLVSFFSLVMFTSMSSGREFSPTIMPS